MSPPSDPLSPSDLPPPPPPPRGGWLRTLARCVGVTALLSALGAAALWWLLHRVAPPWFLPRAVFEWLLAHVAPYAAWLGAIVGAIAGFLTSVGILSWDARRGRLSRLR